ncbi:MAG: hypothetical protein V3W04_08180 [Gammaproteobacteria bacterium]
MLLSILKKIQGGLLVASYPLIIYFLITHGVAWLGAVFIFAMILWKIHQRDNRLWWILGLSVFMLLTIRLFGVEAIPKLTPLLIHTGLFYIFSQSLKNAPLIEQFARLDYPDLPPEIETYCRQLTILWSGFFALNIIACFWLALWGKDTWWVLYNSVIIYALIATLMLGEYIWRHIRFPDIEIPSFSHTIKNIIKNGHTIWGHKTHDNR